MNRTKFFRRILSLALAVVIAVNMVPAISTKAASSSWIKVTSENKDTMDENLSDVSALIDNGKEEYIKAFKIAYKNTQSGERYIIGKKGTDYVYYDDWNRNLLCVTGDEIDQDTYHTYYYHPQYTVTFDLNGGNLAVTTDKTAGGLLTSMPTPTKEGYIFTGWFSTLQGTEGLSLYKEYNAPTTIYAHWHKWTGNETWVRATTISDLENADLPIFTSSVGEQFLNTYYTADSLPEDAYEVIIGKFYSYGVNYWTTSKETDASGKLSTRFYLSNDTLAENMRNKIVYVLKDPNAVAPATPEPATPAPGTPEPATPAPGTPEPATPAPGTPEPGTPAPATPEPGTPEPAIPEPGTPAPATPEPGTPAPATPAPGTPAPGTPAPTPGDSGDNTSESEPQAFSPVLKTTNIVGEQISGWEAITKAISTQTKEKQQSVSGINQDLLHVDASGFDKTIPAATIKEVSASALRGLHVFVGDSDAVTFLAKNDLSGYKETNFEHKDTITDHSRTIDFTHKQALGATVVFHTTVPVKLHEVTIYQVDADNKRTLIARTVSNANGQVCFQITGTAIYVLEY